MDPVERLVRVLTHRATDRPPVIGVTNSVTLDLMDSVGATFPEAHHDPVRMMRLGAAAHEVCGLESVKVPFDLTVETGALGADIDYGAKDTLPRAVRPPFETPKDLIAREDFVKGGRIPVVLEAIRLSRKKYGDSVPVISSIVGPFTLSTLLFGMERLFIWMMQNPDLYSAALQKATGLCTVYAREQFVAGSHVVQVADPSASRDLISSEKYGALVAPYHRQLCSALTGPIVIHVCGDITGHLESIADTGAAGISFDYKTNIEAAKKGLQGRMALIGYVPTSLLREGKPEEVHACSKACLDAGVDALNAGCAWPLDTPTENIVAMVDAVGHE
jgi:[methyl-Co(III) methanol-specific corrinoid protein]:coenzyme M methyltransferase